MSEPIDQKRGRAIYSAAERFNTLSAFFAALFGLIVGICGTLTAGKIWLRGIVRQEVNYQQEPRIAFYQALSHFAAEREDDGFRALDESLALYEARRGEVTPEEYENMLHNYIYYLGRARRPERQQNRLERLV